MLISCTGQSEIAKYADFSFICPDAAEETKYKYMTKSFTSMLLCFQLMTACISKIRERTSAITGTWGQINQRVSIITTTIG
jgi:DNA-binding MurR/RpiR family transcriptional regulator